MGYDSDPRIHRVDDSGVTEMYVLTGTPWGLLSSLPFDYEYVILLQGTRTIYCPNPYTGDGQVIVSMN